VILASSGYDIIGILIITLVALATAIMIASHTIGPRRHGRIKDSTYEAGVDPIGDARQRFSVRFYIVAMLFLLFDVEIVFFYPWGVLFPRLRSDATWAQPLIDSGFNAAYFLGTMLVFVAILLVGYVYAWRRGVFKWA
jgi:NADH-quinone oxidoreductase subunit A